MRPSGNGYPSRVRLRRAPGEETAPESAAATDAATADRAVKGRPTPKRRDAAPRRQPVSAPRTNKEATQWRKQQASSPSRPGNPSRMTNQELRAARARGDESALPGKDRGPARRYTRDWVDSHRLVTNYLLLLLPIYLVGTIAFPPLSIAAAAALLVMVVECNLTARRVRRSLIERFETTKETPFGLTFYILQRAYLPRRMRIPKPTLKIGDPI